MNENKTHDKCKHFSHAACPYWDNDIMKQAAQNIPEKLGRRQAILTYPPPEEINRLCEKCEAFAPKPDPRL